MEMRGVGNKSAELAIPFCGNAHGFRVLESVRRSVEEVMFLQFPFVGMDYDRARGRQRGRLPCNSLLWECRLRRRPRSRGGAQDAEACNSLLWECSILHVVSFTFSTLLAIPFCGNEIDYWASILYFQALAIPFCGNVSPGATPRRQTRLALAIPFCGNAELRRRLAN